MGKGDKKTKRGKIIMGSYGVRRQRNKKSGSQEPVAVEHIQEDKQKEVKPKPKAKVTKKSKEAE